MGFPGSGLTNNGGTTGHSLFSVKHEIGHYLFGGGHPTHGNSNHYGFWGIMTSNPHLCITAYERERLNWINFNDINPGITNVTISDFVTTGSAYRIIISGTNQAFILENHQKLDSYFDDPNYIWPGKGLFIYRVNNIDAHHPNYNLACAEGDFNWTNPYWIDHPWSTNPLDSLPVYKQLLANRSGLDGRDAIPHTKGGSGRIFALDINGQPWVHERLWGNEKDAFNIGYNQVFSPWSNPNSKKFDNNLTDISIEITGKSIGVSGEDIFNVTFYNVGAIQSSPAKPINLVVASIMNNCTSLSWGANIESDLVGYNIYRGVVYAGSSEPTYTKINPSVVTGTTYTDNNYGLITGLPHNIDLYHRYRITAVDNQSKESVKSEFVDAYFTHIASGTISSNKTYIINVNVLDDVTVQNGVTLTINPGTRIIFENGKSLTVNGKLIAKGTPTQRITFTSSNATPQPGYWGGIVFSGGGPDTLTYCDVRYAERSLFFINTAPNCYIAYDTVSHSSGYGVAISSTGTSSTAVRIYKSSIRNNRTEGLRVNNARVNISNSRIENNGAGNINSGIIVTNAGRLFIDSSFVANNLGSGIDVSGIGSRVSLSPDEIKRGYNTITGNGLGEIYVRNSATALLGYTATINYCICEQNPVDKSEDEIKESFEILEKAPACPPGCFPAVRYEPRAGWNNVYNNFTHSCRLINNTTSNLVSARYNYWGTGSWMFCGPVDTARQLISPVNTPTKLYNEDMYAEEYFTKDNKVRIIEWLLQLKSDIESNAQNSIDALHQLELYAGPGGEYGDILPLPWEFLLASVERNSRLSNVKSLASVLFVKAKMDRGEFSNAIYIADQILRRNNDDNMWFFCQTQKVIANVGLGNLANAMSLFNAIKSRGEKIDKKSIEVLEDYLKNVSITNSNVKISEYTIQTVQKNNIEDSNIERPKTYRLEQCYPNPFNPVTQIKFSIPEAGYITLKIYDVLGREVAVLVNEHKEAGYYDVIWNAANVPSGVFFYKIAAGNFTSVRKMLLAK